MTAFLVALLVIGDDTFCNTSLARSVNRDRIRAAQAPASGTEASTASVLNAVLHEHLVHVLAQPHYVSERAVLAVGTNKESESVLRPETIAEWRQWEPRLSDRLLNAYIKSKADKSNWLPPAFREQLQLTGTRSGAEVVQDRQGKITVFHYDLQFDRPGIDPVRGLAIVSVAITCPEFHLSQKVFYFVRRVEGCWHIAGVLETGGWIQ